MPRTHIPARWCAAVTLLPGALLSSACGPEPVHYDLDLGFRFPYAERGLCVSLGLDREDEAHRRAQLDALSSLGVQEIRHDLLWADVAPARGTWDWSTEDAWVDAAVDAGFEVIATAAYGNAWASSDPEADDFYPPDMPSDFGYFVNQAAARYEGKITRFEVWNEPNRGSTYWKVGHPPAPSGDPVAYQLLFEEAERGIGEVDELAQVYVGGTYYQPTDGAISGPDFLLATHGLGDMLQIADGVAFHPYMDYPPQIGPEGLGVGDPVTSQSEMAAATRDGALGKPLLISNVGWPSWGAVSEQDQADFLVRGFALAQADGVRDYCVNTLEDGPDADVPEQNFGLFRDGANEMKPAGEALQALAGHIHGMDSNGDAAAALGVPSGVAAVRWSSPTAAATVYWSLDGAHTVSVRPTLGMCGAPKTIETGATPVWVDEVSCE